MIISAFFMALFSFLVILPFGQAIPPFTAQMTSWENLEFKLSGALDEKNRLVRVQGSM